MKRLIGILLYLCALALMGLDVYQEYFGGQVMSIAARLIFAGMVFVLTLISYRLLKTCFPAQQPKLFALTVWVLFLYYICILAALLFFSYDMGRHVTRQGLNLHPLTTIRNYYFTYHNGHMTRENFFINMLGNILAFAPLGFFGPAIFRRMRPFWGFFWRMGVIIALVEIVQLMTYTGSCDVDDWILNMCGAVWMYLWMQLPYFRRIRL